MIKLLDKTTKGTKRSTEVRIFHVSDSGMTQVMLPSATDQAFELLKATESHRCVFQRPQKWIDDKTLIVRTSGDIIDPTGGKIPLWYEVDVTFDIQTKKVSEVTVIETKPDEGK